MTDSESCVRDSMCSVTRWGGGSAEGGQGSGRYSAPRTTPTATMGLGEFLWLPTIRLRAQFCLAGAQESSSVS